jgi:hypothetical protein
MRKPIVAVVGGNSDVNDIIKDVRKFGASLEDRLILLTGGRPTRSPTTVKDAAMSGAKAKELM